MGRPVWQSSGDDLAPSRANDGNFDPRLEYGSCIRTQSSHLRPWWAVDLGSSYRISHVLVTTRNMRSMYNNGVVTINSSPPGQNGRHFSDEIFRCIFVNVKFCILIKISLKFVPNGPIYNNPVLVEIMDWHRIGDKPLSEPMLTWLTDAYMRHYGDMS